MSMTIRQQGSQWIFYFISNLINDIKLMWEETGHGIRPAKREVRMLLYKEKKNGRRRPYESWHSNYSFNGRRHNHKYVSFSTDVLSYSIHIRFFSQNQSLLSLIENQNITKRVERIKLNNADDDSLVTTQVEVEDKDGYYKQDKDDDKHVYVSIVILPYCIQYTYNSSHKINLFFFSL